MSSKSGSTRRPAARPGTTKARPAPGEARATEVPELRDGVRVSAVKVHRGPPATTIHVEVDREKVRAAIGDDELDEVVARVPEQGGEAGDVRWQSEKLDRERAGPGSSVHYSATHYGPSDAARRGVGVVIKTKRGSVEARAGGEVRETDKPEGGPRAGRP